MDRSPLVLVHGFTATPGVWAPVLPRLAEHHDVHVPALAGHAGGVAVPDGFEATITVLVDDLEAQLDRAGLETAHLAGNSLGGWLALELAARGRARSVVCLSPGGGWEPGSREEARIVAYFVRTRRLLRHVAPRARTLASRPRLRRLAMRDVCQHGERLTPAQAEEAIRGAWECALVDRMAEAVRRDGPLRELEPLTCPVRIAWAEHDRILPSRGYSERFRRLLPDAEYTTLPGVGHVPMADDPELVARTILEVSAAGDRQAAVAAA